MPGIQVFYKEVHPNFKNWHLVKSFLALLIVHFFKEVAGTDESSL